jgi:hypothetical protein
LRNPIALAYVLVTGGRLPTNLDALLRAIRVLVPDVTEADVRDRMDAATGAAPRAPASAPPAPATATCPMMTAVLLPIVVWRRVAGGSPSISQRCSGG